MFTIIRGDHPSGRYTGKGVGARVEGVGVEDSRGETITDA